MNIPAKYSLPWKQNGDWLPLPWGIAISVFFGWSLWAAYGILDQERKKAPSATEGKDAGENDRSMLDAILNILIFLVTAAMVVFCFRKDGKWAPEQGKQAFRFFTVQSNTLCAAASLLMGLAALSGAVPDWIWTLKYIGTAAVTVTMLTVFFFLAPSVGKDWIQVLLKGIDLFLHLLTPLMALISFCVLEKRGMGFTQSLLGLLPVMLYGPVYLYKILFAPEEKRWKDFYGFNKSGKWPVSFAAMLTGTFLICMGIRFLQNI